MNITVVRERVEEFEQLLTTYQNEVDVLKEKDVS